VARSCNLCYRGKAISMPQYKCVLEALVIQHAMRRRHIVICGLPRCTILKYVTSFRKMLLNIKMCVLIFSTTFVRNISHSNKNLERYDKTMSTGLHVKYPHPLFFYDCNATLIFFRQIFEKYSNIKFS